jgi:hypothetical protein
MSTVYPLAVIDAASITHLATTTLCHYSISLCPTTVEGNKGTMTLVGKARDAAAKDLITLLAAASAARGVQSTRGAIEGPKSE